MRNIKTNNDISNPFYIQKKQIKTHLNESKQSCIKNTRLRNSIKIKKASFFSYFIIF
jgi:hypothetical protein